MNNTAALLNRHAQDEIARLIQPLAPIKNQVGAITAEQFLCHVLELAVSLPGKHHGINHCLNLCHNRYLFMVTFCAVIVRSHTNLLPSNKNLATQSRLAERYKDTYIVHDGEVELALNIDAINLQEMFLETSNRHDFEIPQISLEHIAAISFTSGSTGDAKAIVKTWRTFTVSTQINSQYMLPNDKQKYYHLATVPSQHMWGLETTVLMAMLSRVCLVDAQPFYPQDIFAILAKLPAPKALITTPMHLRAINTGNVDAISVDNILVATSPLNQELAISVEAKLNTQLREVYGCSEVGSMSIRRTAKTEQWTRFDGLDFSVANEGAAVVSADHIIESVKLDDQITFLDEDHFLLAGRNTDQINIAGKRGSLLEVNNILMKFTGVIDGVVIFPPQNSNVPRLVAMVVMSETETKNELRNHFSRYLDSAFVPRPIIVVDKLPREENGKLIKSKLLELYKISTAKEI